MERDWERLGRAFAKARTAAGLTQEQVAERLHVSRTPIQAIERGRQPNGKAFTKVTATMRAYARLVGWTEESADRILDGQEPEQATPVPPPAESKSDLPPAVDRELRSGKTLDHAVVHLGGEDDEDDFRLVVIVKGAENMTEEEIDRRYEQWRRMRRHLQAIPGETDTPNGS
ncbi:helix-turn-helix domain-containing protein [Streptomyces sp. NPDC020747]|uniref:helix-turn-helix domain-containing protein n=1 Tax=Streptomyces sp. NPDC020747 TaxID=3365086 RepID=UPI00379AD676